MVGGWIASYVFIYISWSRCFYSCCLLLLLSTISVLKRREMLSRSEGLVRVRVHPHRGRRAALARWQGRVSAVSHTRPNHSALKLFFCDFTAARPRFVARLARSDSPQSPGPCPRADPPSLWPSRSASELARSRLPCLPHAPYVFARTSVPIYCSLLLLLGLLPDLPPSNRFKKQLPLHVP